MKRLPFLASLLGFSVAAKAQSSLPPSLFEAVANSPFTAAMRENAELRELIAQTQNQLKVLSDAKEQTKAQGRVVEPFISRFSDGSSTTLPKPANGECPLCGTKSSIPKPHDDLESGDTVIHGCRHCRVVYFIEVE